MHAAGQKEARPMTMVIKCGDVVADCPGELRAASEDELMRLVAEHGATVHGLTEIDDVTLAKVKSAVRTEP